MKRLTICLLLAVLATMVLASSASASLAWTDGAGGRTTNSPSSLAWTD